MSELAQQVRVRPGRVDGLRRLSMSGVYLAIAALVVFNVLFTPHFVSAENLRTQLVQVAPIAIVALGMALVIGTEGVDLSVGSVMALAAAVIPVYLGYGALVAVVVAIIAGALVGLTNGVLVAWVGLQPIVATLALFVGIRGLALVIANGQLQEIHNPTLISFGTSTVAGLPVTAVLAAALAIIVAVLVHRTVLGRQLLAVGGNRTAAELAGVPVKRVLLIVYLVCALLAAVAGVAATARLQASDPSSLGLLIELAAITAVVVGGTPLSGGRVSVVGTVAGAVLMQLIRATLIKHNLPDSLAQMIQAVIIVSAVYLARDRATR